MLAGLYDIVSQKIMLEMAVNMESSNNYQVSRYNATKHGLKAKDAVLPWENIQDFESLQNCLIDEYQPKTPTQHELVGQLTQIFWRQRRIFTAENAMLEAEAETKIRRNHQYSSFKGFNELTSYDKIICNSSIERIDTTDKLIRYDAHLSRRLARTLGLLHQLKMVENSSNTVNC